MENVPGKNQTAVAKLARDGRRSENPLSRGVFLFFWPVQVIENVFFLVEDDCESI
jgi:hypothetical protein